MADKADHHGNLYTGANTEDTPAIIQALKNIFSRLRPGIKTYALNDFSTVVGMRKIMI